MAVGTRIDFLYANNARVRTTQLEDLDPKDVRPFPTNPNDNVKLGEPPVSDQLSSEPLFESRVDVPERILDPTEKHDTPSQIEALDDPIDAIIPGKYLSLFPYACIGKVDILFPTGRGVGSAFMVAADTIMTVGHNVIDHTLDRHGRIVSTEEADALYFSPGYDGPTHGALYGSWAADWAWVTSAWVEEADSRYDVAIIRMHPHEGQRIGDAVGGWLGAHSHNDYYAQWSMFGYPYIASVKDNPQLRQVNSIGVGGDMNWNADHPMAARSTVFQGMSGGPWFRDFNPNDYRTFGVHGMNTYTRNHGYQYSVYFGQTIQALIGEYFSLNPQASA